MSTEGGQPPDDRLAAFEERLRKVRSEVAPPPPTAADRTVSGYGMAFRIAADLVGGIVGGAGLGWLIDRWLGTAPAGLIGFFFLGAIAGMWNVYRTVRGFGASLGFQPAPPKPTAAREEQTKGSAGARPDAESGDHRGQSTRAVPGQHADPDRDRRG